MSSSSQTPEPLHEFDRITSSVTRVSAGTPPRRRGGRVVTAVSQIAILGRRAGLSESEADAVAQQLSSELCAEVLREAEGIASEIFDAADERGDRAGADVAEQIADRLAREARESEGGAS